MDICKVPLTTKCIFQSAQIWQHTVLPANKPYMPLFSSHKASPLFGWYSFYRPTERRRLSRPGWLVTCRNKVSSRESNPDTVRNPSTNGARRRLTSLINALPLRQTATMCANCARPSCTTQHQTVLITFPLILRTLIIAQMNRTNIMPNMQCIGRGVFWCYPLKSMNQL